MREQQVRNGRRFQERRRAWINEEKAKPCADCGNQYPARAMDFHHREDEDKDFQISEGKWGTKARLISEIAKCDVLCAVCHRLRH